MIEKHLEYFIVSPTVALKAEHERQLNEITERFEGIKHSLSVSTNAHNWLVVIDIWWYMCIFNHFVDFACFLPVDILYLSRVDKYVT